VSDTWQGEGWWIASDGKWYPPESHPDSPAPAAPVPVAPAPTVPTTSAASVTPAPPAAAAPTSRWLGRNPQLPAAATATLDDSPAPPPAAPPPAAPTSRRWSKPPAAPAPVPLPPAVTPMASAPLGTPVRRRPPQRPVAIWVFISIGAVALTTLIAALVFIGGRGDGPGHETGTITVIFRTAGRPTFSGTINGTALTGKVTASTFGTGVAANGQISPTANSFVYKGRYGANPYVLHVSLTTPSPTFDHDGQWQITGTDGSSRVNGEVNFNQEGTVIPFSGTIGSEPVLGSAEMTARSADSVEVTVSFVNLS
jgi:hypothetical protein